MKKKFEKAKLGASRLMAKLNSDRRSRSHSPNAHSTDPSASLPVASQGRHTYADPEAPQAALATTGSIALEFLASARDASDLCLPLKAALVAAVKIFEICERTAEVNDQYNNVGSRLAHLGAVTGALSKRSHIDPNLLQRLSSIADSFSRLTACVEAKQTRGTVRRSLESQADVAEVKDLLAKISARIEAFIYESIIRVEIRLDEILTRLPTAEEKELEKDLANWNALAQVINSALGERRVHEAAHYSQASHAGCMPGTRVNVLSKFVDWVKNDPMSIFWLAGMAGTGKSSIAVSLCRALQNDSEVLLGGAFFCSRTTNEEARADVRRILPTLVALLAEQSPKFAAALAAELKPSSSAAVHKPTSEQIVPLLQQPLAALSSETRPIVFVIDALDECSNERELSELLKAIATFTCAARVKFILTSRPETHILGSPISDGTQSDILQLHEIGTEDVTEDIYTYISRTFEQHPLASPEPWYSDREVRTLATLSNGLFIFASTAIAYILDTESVEDRTARLQTTLSTMKDSEVATGPLDNVYEFVITQASHKTKVEPKELVMTHQALACILSARVPLSVSALADLVGRKVDGVRASLRRLRAVVHVPEALDQPGLRTLHASFGDYLFERAAPNLRIARSLGDETLARGCLHVMAEKLHFNVSQSQSSYEPNPAVKPGFIAPSLDYACLQWIYHVSSLQDPSQLEDAINSIFRPRMLFWLEIMSLLGQVWRAAAMLMFAAATVRSNELSHFLRDANAFVASSQEAIMRSTAHIYLSALPFASKDSLVYQTFVPLCTGLISVDTYGIVRHGSRLVMTLAGHNSGVTSAAYSSDGRFIVSGSDDNTVRIWDTRTGKEIISPLRGEEGAVWSVAFAPNGKNIAAGTEAGNACVWTLPVGQTSLRRLRGHSSAVRSVIFSPNGALLATGSTDKTVRLWHTETGNLHATLNGHTDTIHSVTFSSDGATIASCSDDRTIRMWHVTTGEPLGEPLGGEDGMIFCVCFSPDGTKLASGDTWNNVQLWNVQTATEGPRLKGHSDWVRFVQFAPDGQSLVSASDDRSLRIWTVPQGTDQAASTVLAKHTKYVRSVAFSPDGLYIASASDDHTIRIWDASGARQAVQPLPSHTDFIRSVGITPDGAFIVSGSDDRSVRVWDLQTGEEQLAPLRGHTFQVYSVIISSNGDLIASAGADDTVRLWNRHTGEAVGDPLTGHESTINSLSFSPDALFLISGSDDRTVRIWDIKAGGPTKIDPLRCTSAVQAVAFSPDGQLIAAGDTGGHLYLWHAGTSQQACEPLQASWELILSLDFSPDSARIVSGAGDSKGRVWDVSTRKQLLVLDGHTGWVRSIRYSLDGRFICSGSGDDTVRLWDASTGGLLATMYGHNTSVASVAFSPDGRLIASSSFDRTIRVWDVDAALQGLEGDTDPTVMLTSATYKDGWFLGPLGELLLWVPTDYHEHLQIAPCTLRIGPRRVTVTVGNSGWYHGKSWTSCWKKDVQNNISRAM